LCNFRTESSNHRLLQNLLMLHLLVKFSPFYYFRKTIFLHWHSPSTY
jgi:hypothetical protein